MPQESLKKCTPTSHDFTRVSLYDLPWEWAQEPFTNHLIGADNNHQSCSTITPIFGLARWRQSPRVTRDPPTQLAQLLPQDARPLRKCTRCSPKWRIKRFKWVECISQPSRGVHKYGVPRGWSSPATPSIYSPHKKTNCYLLMQLLRGHRTCPVAHRTPHWKPQWLFSNSWKTSHFTLSDVQCHVRWSTRHIWWM
jgi:hypothetical protein